MKWQRGYKSDQVEDRRGQGGRRGVPLTLGTLVLGLAAYFLLGQDIFGLLGGGVGDGAPSAPATSSPEEQERVEFISFVLDDVQANWKALFSAEGKRYEAAKLVLFRDGVSSACGYQGSAVGPFYCPGDKKAYIDLSFYDDLKRRFGAPGDFAQAYVLAHEIGHHVQNLLGDNRRIHEQQRANPDQKNALSIKLELQADCYAGVWAHSTKKRDLLDKGDIKEGLDAAAAIGDDRLQKGATGEVHPERWTHGSSEQRMRWFKKGLDLGTIAACDTFAVGEP
ncbi:MAG: neutral zinc metallopeptidase [Polyangiaceae bacterium]